MQIKTPCCKLYLQQGAEKQIEQLSVSFIRTIPSAPESHRISGCINSRSRACGNAIYRRWGIAPRPETDFLALSIAQVLQIARGCAIIDKNKFGDWVVFPCCLVHSEGLGQHRTIPALRLKHRSGSCGTASALPKCSIMSGCGTRIVLRGQKPSHSATAAPASVRCFRHWRRSPLQHPVLSALLAWHLPHLARRIGT